jgi:type I restriction enzyme S subunit
MVEGFQNTDAGIIPIDWKVKKLSEISSFENGKAHEQFIDDRGDFIVVNSKFISTEGEVQKFSNKNLSPLQKGNIAIVMSDIPNGKALAKCFLVDKDNFYTLNQRIGSIKANEEIDNEYLFYILNRNKYFLAFDSGAGQTNLKKSEILDCPITLPPTKAEQTAIATALHDADALITQLEKLIAKKRNIKQGAMQELLKPKAGWELKKLGEVLKVRHGKSQKEVNDDNGIYPILASGGVIGKANRFLYDKPSVLIGRKGTIDKPQFMNTPFWTVDTLFYTEIFENYDAKFIFYMFNLIDWYSYNEASGVPSLNAKTIEMIEKGVPKSKSEQIYIAQILSDMDAEIDALEKKLEKYTMIKQGMVQNLLTGRTRLV